MQRRRARGRAERRRHDRDVVDAAGTRVFAQERHRPRVGLERDDMTAPTGRDKGNGADVRAHVPEHVICLQFACEPADQRLLVVAVEKNPLLQIVAERHRQQLPLS